MLRLAAGLEVIHQPQRLAIMTVLTRQRDVGFSPLREATGLTAGNLRFHADKLVEAGLVEERETFDRDGLSVRFRLTRLGDSSWQQYIEALSAFVAQQGS